MGEYTYTCTDGTVLDLHAELVTILRLPYVRAARKRRRGARFVPSLKVRDKPVTQGHLNRDRGPYSGHCMDHDGSIVLSLRKGALDSATARMILLHEVCHSVAPEWKHGRKWQTLYRRAANAYFGIDLPSRSATGHRSKYAIDKEIVNAVRVKATLREAITLGEATVAIDGVPMPDVTLATLTLAWEGEESAA